MRRAAIYARFSTDLQSETSADDQVSLCRDFAVQNGVDVVATFSDPEISGTAFQQRPGIKALLAAAEAGAFNLVIAESLDRISRDQEHTAAIYKRLKFHDVPIVTLFEGEISEIHVGMKGTVNALFITDQAKRIRGRQRVKVQQGKVPGGLRYGYVSAPRIGDDGSIERGLLRIDEDQATIVRRIFAERAQQKSLRDICRDLNRDGVPSPSGRQWGVSTLSGSKARGSGILRNPIYIGMPAFGRVRMVRNPMTEKRLSRPNAPKEVTTGEVPELRIVDQATWDKVQELVQAMEGVPVRQQRKPRHLFSGLVKCGVCGSSYVIQSQNRLGCAGAKSGKLCGNLRKISIPKLERRVLGGMRASLLEEKATERAIAAIKAGLKKKADRNRLARVRAEQDLATADSAIARLIAAIADGAADFPEIREALAARRAERDAAQALIASEVAANVIVLHPQLRASWKRMVDELTEAQMRNPEDIEKVGPKIRALTSAIVATPSPGSKKGLDLKVRTHLANVFALATGQSPIRQKMTVELVAEEGLEPPTRGL